LHSQANLSAVLDRHRSAPSMSQRECSSKCICAWHGREPSRSRPYGGRSISPGGALSLSAASDVLCFSPRPPCQGVFCFQYRSLCQCLIRLVADNAMRSRTERCEDDDGEHSRPNSHYIKAQSTG